VEEKVVWWGWWGWWRWMVGDLIMRWWWVDVGQIMNVIERGFLSLLLLVKDIDSILQLCELCLLSVDMLSMGFSALCDGLPSHNGFLFLPEPLYFLLNAAQPLLFFCGFVLFDFHEPILHLNLVEISIALNIMYRWECPWG
jgi:hypothetical protein